MYILFDSLYILFDSFFTLFSSVQDASVEMDLPSDSEVPSRHKSSKHDVYITARDQLFSEDLPHLPREFKVWLKSFKGLAKATAQTYSLEIRQFFAFVKRTLKRQPRLEDAWNVDVCKRFLHSLIPVYAPTTVVNYHNSLSTVRQFLQVHGRRPLNFQDVREVFRILCAAARKRRREHLRGQKAGWAENPLLGRFY